MRKRGLVSGILAVLFVVGLGISVSNIQTSQNIQSSLNSEVSSAKSAVTSAFYNLCNVAQNQINSIVADNQLTPQQKNDLIDQNVAMIQRAENETKQRNGIDLHCNLTIPTPTTSTSSTSASSAVSATSIASTTATASLTSIGDRIVFRGGDSLLSNGTPTTLTFGFNMTWQNFTVTERANATNPNASFFWSLGVKIPDVTTGGTSLLSLANFSGDGLNGSMTFDRGSFSRTDLVLLVESQHVDSWTVVITSG